MIHFQVMDDNDESGEHDHPHRKFWQLNWSRVHFTGLPEWLQDNEFV